MIRLFALAIKIIAPLLIAWNMTVIYATKNIVTSPTFLVWKFCGKAKFRHSFGPLARNYKETVPFHKISTLGN